MSDISSTRLAHIPGTIFSKILHYYTPCARRICCAAEYGRVDDLASKIDYEAADLQQNEIAEISYYYHDTLIGSGKISFFLPEYAYL